MKRPFFYFILLLSVCLNSCITYIEKDLDIKPKLVLHCYLVPQLDTTILHLSSTTPLFTSNPRKMEEVPDATVEISADNKQWVRMEYYPEFKFYLIPQTQFPIIEGKTYYIRASAPGFESVSSSCTVPYLRETNLELVFKESINDIHGGKYYSLLHHHGFIEWTDYPGEDNYYIFYNKEFIWWEMYEDLGNYEWQYDTLYGYHWGILYEEIWSPCIYSDYGQDGKRNSVFMMIDFTSKYEMTLLQTDKQTYLYYTSLLNYDETLVYFMLEPMQLYTNIQNGYGVFGAFVMRDYSFEFEEPTKLISFSSETTSIP